jgi:hypothetical protein
LRRKLLTQLCWLLFSLQITRLFPPLPTPRSRANLLLLLWWETLPCFTLRGTVRAGVQFSLKLSDIVYGRCILSYFSNES